MYTLNQLHSYDWVAWNAAFAAMLQATGLGALRNGMFPKPLASVTIVIGATLLTPLGFFGFILLPAWLVVSGLWLTFRDRARSRAAVTRSVDKPTRGVGVHHLREVYSPIGADLLHERCDEPLSDGFRSS